MSTPHQQNTDATCSSTPPGHGSTPRTTPTRQRDRPRHRGDSLSTLSSRRVAANVSCCGTGPGPPEKKSSGEPGTPAPQELSERVPQPRPEPSPDRLSPTSPVSEDSNATYHSRGKQFRVLAPLAASPEPSVSSLLDSPLGDPDESDGNQARSASSYRGGSRPEAFVRAGSSDKPSFPPRARC